MTAPYCLDIWLQTVYVYSKQYIDTCHFWWPWLLYENCMPV